MKPNRTIALILCAAITLSAAVLAAESAVADDFNTADHWDEMVNGLDNDNEDVPMVIAPAPQEGCPLTVNGADKGNVPVMVPLRVVAEALGFSVIWNGDGTITLDSGEGRYNLTVGLDEYQFITGIEGAYGVSAPVSMGGAPYVADDVTYVPLKIFDIILGDNAVTLENGGITIRTGTTEPEGLRPPSPYIPCADMEEAAGLAGFTMDAPEKADAIEAWKGHMIQLLYGVETETMCIRKAIGSEDISGDYNIYTQVKRVDGVTLKGDDNAFVLAIWAGDGYTYSVSVSRPLPQAELLELAARVR